MIQISKTPEDIKTSFTILHGLARLANTSIYKDVTMGYTTYGTFNNSAVGNSELFKKDAKTSRSHSEPSIWRRAIKAVSHTGKEQKEQAAPPMDFEQYRIRCV